MQRYGKNAPNECGIYLYTLQKQTNIKIRSIRCESNYSTCVNRCFKFQLKVKLELKFNFFDSGKCVFGINSTKITNLGKLKT